jgi:putative endonuclease
VRGIDGIVRVCEGKNNSSARAGADSSVVIAARRKVSMPVKAPLTDKQLRGQAGEDLALGHLLRQGLTLIERNFRCKVGEIDLIMAQHGGLVFVEVRQRASTRFGGAAASVGFAKQRRLVRAAQLYLLRYRTPPACRFDVVAIDGSAVEWIQDAIQAC